MKATFYRISNGVITRSIDCSEHDLLLNAPTYVGESYIEGFFDKCTHVVDGKAVTVAYVPTPEELISEITRAIQKHIDMISRTRNYDSILSLASYASSSDPAFAAEGIAGAEWRDACWRYCYQALAEVQAGKRALPTPQEAVTELPPMVWP